MDKKEYVEIDLLKLAKAVMKKLWAIILAAIICGGAFLGYTMAFIEPEYEANAVIYVNNNNVSVGGTDFVISSSSLTAAQELVNTYIVILNSRTTINKIIAEADVDRSYTEVKEMMEAAPVDSTEIFEIVVTSTDPQEATDIANAITQVLPNRIADIVDGSSVRIVDYAVVPATHSSPSYVLNTIIGIILGILFSTLIVVIRSLQDKFIREEGYLSGAYSDIPVLASIPDVSNPSSSYAYKSYGYAKPAPNAVPTPNKAGKGKSKKPSADVLNTFNNKESK